MTTPEQKAVYGKGRTTAQRAEAKGNISALGKLAKVLEDQGLDLSDLGEVRAIWAKTSIDGEGVEQYAGSSVLLSPSWEQGPRWPLVQPAKPVKVTVPRRHRGVVGTWRTCVVLPDQQYGYRRLNDGTLDPFHDARALDIATQIMEAERPDLTILLGDVLDLPVFGSYRQEPGFAQTVQPALDRAHQDIATWRALTGELRYIEGNHDLRLRNFILDNAMAAFGLRRAGDAPDSWPVLSVPNLLRLEELGVEYVGAYPSGATYINDNFAAIHGRVTGNKLRSAASLVVEDETVSVVFGHVHRIEARYKTRNSRGAPKFSAAYTPGCLCRIDGAVPSMKSGLTDKGRPVKSWEDWQQGVMVVRYQEGNGRFSVEMVPIIEGWAQHRGQDFVSDLEVNAG